MGCSKTKDTCIDKTYSTCVYYELPLPDISELAGACVTIEETTEELYKLVKEIKTEIDLETFTSVCDEVENLTLAEIIVEYDTRICTLREQVNALQSQNLCSQSLENCDLDLQSLVDVCGTQPQTVGELLQIIINQITT